MSMRKSYIICHLSCWATIDQIGQAYPKPNRYLLTLRDFLTTLVGNILYIDTHD
ncbi:hypothetical protein MICAG_2340018 [Microcystis aeruginosa PCC 9808]|uniref:Uncharacterized protein n=1 Tax=Microcystis aeruginosa PCC 9808 TaxID=1160284 RepID=I4HPT7_MICAE|nr:hypothetical protein MICAG_2340018 [Microcystis aeruginosa PCC 9808]